MSNAFIRKLEHGADLTPEDRATLEAATRRHRWVPAREDLIHEGEGPEAVHLILEGLACRYKTLPSGARQIVAFLLPGDSCDLRAGILGEMDHSVATLSRCQVVDLQPEDVASLSASPRINRALVWATLADQAATREWLVNMGRRPADRRMAHLFCELFARLRAVGRTGDDGYPLPLTQEELGDTLGLSVVHVNRVLQQLREAGLVRFSEKRLTILDLPRLQAFADFNPNYLHLSRRGPGLPRSAGAA